ncbi:Glutamate-gated chloride channel, partial [Gryllus bimaculatus]
MAPHSFWPGGRDGGSVYHTRSLTTLHRNQKNTTTGTACPRSAKWVRGRTATTRPPPPRCPTWPRGPQGHAVAFPLLLLLLPGATRPSKGAVKRTALPQEYVIRIYGSGFVSDLNLERVWPAPQRSRFAGRLRGFIRGSIYSILVNRNYKIASGRAKFILELSFNHRTNSLDQASPTQVPVGGHAGAPYLCDLFQTTRTVEEGLQMSQYLYSSIVFLRSTKAKSCLEISLDVFLYVYWMDTRISLKQHLDEHVEITWEHRHALWVPDLYIRQLREMKVLSLFEDMTSLRLYRNSTLRISFGATIIIKCDMDFVLYPLDVQQCVVDFSSYKYTMTEVVFHWRNGEKPLSFPSDFGGDGYRLPNSFIELGREPEASVYPTIERRGPLADWCAGNHSTARMLITMSRELRSYLLESYLPSSLFVIMSWGSFIVIPDMVPGRMVLLVTTLLSLVTMFDTVRNNSPSALELKCIEVWLISCTLFVFFALLEYFVVLFGIRYDKYWRHKKRDLELLAAGLPPGGGGGGRR